MYLPRTTDWLQPPPMQEAPNSTAVGAYNVFLHDGSFFHSQTDLAVRSVGIDFAFSRIYRSNITTLQGGVLGHGWDFSLNKRIVPLLRGLHLPRRDGLIHDGFPTPGDMMYYNGLGRADQFRHLHSEVRMVKNFGTQFRAFVSTYEAPRGFFMELQRYGVLPPYQHPFAGHPDADGRVFYVMRYKDGHRDIFNCRGQIIYATDRHGNRMEFRYGLPFNPLTQNPLLKTVIDTIGRVYSFSYRDIDVAELFTWYRGQTLRGQQPIPRLKRIDDPDRRAVIFYHEEVEGFEEFPLLMGVDRPRGTPHEIGGVRYNLENQISYGYGDGYRLESITAPREHARMGREAQPFLINRYDSRRRVERQTLGEPARRVGGDFVLVYEGDTVRIADRAQNRRAYLLKRISDSVVVGEESIENSKGRFGDVKVSEPDRYVTQFRYNADYQPTLVTFPRGNSVTYEYDEANEPVTQGDVRDWLDRDWTYENNLTRGNLVAVLQRTHLGEDQQREIITRYSYEPLFNARTTVTDPRGYTTVHKYDHGWYATPGNNGNPLRIVYPDLTLATGEVLKSPIERFAYNSRGQLTSHTDRGGHTTTYRYDDQSSYLRFVTFPTDPLATVEYVPDRRGNILSYINARGLEVAYEVNDRDLITAKVQDVSGFANRTEYFYDENDQIVKIALEDKDNFAVTETGPPLRPLNIPQRGTRRVETRMFYDILNQRTSQIIDRGGPGQAVTDYHYDPNGNLIRVRSPRAADPRNEDDRYAVVETEYDERDLPVKITRGPGSRYEASERFLYTPNGLVGFHIDGRRGVTFFLYDGYDRVVQTNDPVGTTTDHTYDAGGNETNVVVMGHPGGPSPLDREGRDNVRLHESQSRYDAWGQRYETTVQVFNHRNSPQQDEVQRTQWVFDADGLIRGVIDHSGARRTMEYDGLHRLTATEDALGNRVDYELDSEGNRTKITERAMPSSASGGAPQEYRTIMQYDRLNRPISVRDPGGHYTYTVYDSLDRERVVLDPTSTANIVDYDASGRPVCRTRRAPGHSEAMIEEYEYDANGNLVGQHVVEEHCDPRTEFGHRASTILRYDPLDRLRETNAPSPVEEGARAVTTYDYDQNDNLVFTRDPNLTELRLIYDAANHLEGKNITPVPRLGGAGAIRELFQYDGLGRVTRAEAVYPDATTPIVETAYDSLGRVLEDRQTFRGDTKVTRSTYDSLKRQRLTYPSGSFHLEFVPDPLQRVKEIRSVGEGANYSALAFEYLGVSRRRFTRFGKPVPGDAKTFHQLYRTEYAYNAEGILERVEHHHVAERGPETRLASIYYLERDSLHRPRRRQADGDGSAGLYQDGRLNETWHYDDLGRLVHQVESHPLFAGSENRPWNVKVLCYGTPTQIRGSVGMQVARRQEGARTLHEIRRLITARRDPPGTRPPRVSYEVLEGQKVWAGHDPNEAGVSGAACDRDSLASLERGSNPLERVPTSPAEFRHRPNGTLEVDDYFIYNHDYRDRLVKVLDRVSGQRNVPEWVTYYYDALGRLVFIEPFHADMRRHLVDWSLNMEDLGGRRTLRLLYDGQQVIEELEYREGQPGLLARYIYGPGLNELLIMDRREDDRLDRDLKRYHFHENGAGEIEFLTVLLPGSNGQVAFRPRLNTLSLPRVPWSVGLERPEYRLQERGRTTTPYAGAAVRFDPFSRLMLRDGSGQVESFPYDTPREYFFQRELEAGQAQYRAELYAFHGKALMALAVYSAAPLAGANIALHPIAALMGGGFSVAIDAGITTAYGNEYTLQQGITAFGIGAIGGAGGARLAQAIGKVAGRELLAMGAAAYLTEVTLGAGLDVFVNEVDVEEALVGNAIGTAVGNVIGYGVGRLGRPAMSWLKGRFARRAAQAGTSTQTVSTRVVRKVMEEATEGLEFTVVGQHEQQVRQSIAAVESFLREAAPTQRKARRVLEAWEGGRVKVMAGNPDILAGKHTSGFRRGGFRRDEIIFLNPFDRHGNLRSVADMAGTLIHEYTHWRGGGEERAFLAQYFFLKRLGAIGQSTKRYHELDKVLKERSLLDLDLYLHDRLGYDIKKILTPGALIPIAP